MKGNSSATSAGFVLLSQRVYTLPLGWQLSPQVQDIIAAQVAVDCNFGTEFYQFVNALNTSIKWIDAGLEVVEARQKQRKPRDYFGSPLAEMLEKLKFNHCATTLMLINDDVWKPPI